MKENTFLENNFSTNNVCLKAFKKRSTGSLYGISKYIFFLNSAQFLTSPHY